MLLQRMQQLLPQVSLPERITVYQRIPTYITIGVYSSRQPYRITLDIPPSLRIVITEVVI